MGKKSKSVTISDLKSKIKINNHHSESDFKAKSKDDQIDLKSRFQIK